MSGATDVFDDAVAKCRRDFVCLDMMKLTVALIKPDLCCVPFYVDSVMSEIAARGFLMVRHQQMRLSSEQVKGLYAEHEGKFFSRRLKSFMRSGDIQAMILARDNAVDAWRTMLGASSVCRCLLQPYDNTLRLKYGLTDTRNALHGSDSEESAAREMRVLFPDFCPAQWLCENASRLHHTTADTPPLIHHH